MDQLQAIGKIARIGSGTISEAALRVLGGPTGRFSAPVTPTEPPDTTPEPPSPAPAETVQKPAPQPSTDLVLAQFTGQALPVILEGGRTDA